MKSVYSTTARVVANNSNILLRQQGTGNKVLCAGGEDVLVGRRQARLWKYGLSIRRPRIVGSIRYGTLHNGYCFYVFKAIWCEIVHAAHITISKLQYEGSYYASVRILQLPIIYSRRRDWTSQRQNIHSPRRSLRGVLCFYACRLKTCNSTESIPTNCHCPHSLIYLSVIILWFLYLG